MGVGICFSMWNIDPCYEDEEEEAAVGREDMVDGANFLSANSMAALEIIGGLRQGAAARSWQSLPGTGAYLEIPCCESATFSGESATFSGGSGRPRSRSRLRTKKGGSGFWHLNFSFEVWKIKFLWKSFLYNIFLYKLNWLHVYIPYLKSKTFRFAFLKDPRRLRFSAPTEQKIGSGSVAALKLAAPGGSGSATMVWIYKNYLTQREQSSCLADRLCPCVGPPEAAVGAAAPDGQQNDPRVRWDNGFIRSVRCGCFPYRTYLQISHVLQYIRYLHW